MANDHSDDVYKTPGPDDDPFAEGADAALAGDSDTDNPYAPATEARASWNDGYFSVADQQETDEDEPDEDEPCDD